MNLNRLVALFKSDYKGVLFFTLFRLKNQFDSSIITLIMRLVLNMKGITCGKLTKFRGFPLISRYPTTNISIGNNCSFNSTSKYNFRGINHKCVIQTGPGGSIKIGNNCGFSGVSIVSSKSVVIGDNLLCGANVMIGDRNDHEDIYPQFKPEPVVIGDNVWIGMNSIVMKGVSIGDNVIIGANSIVTKSIPSNVIAAGNPCRIIKENN